MERRAGLCLAGAILALGLAALPATAQKETRPASTTTTTYTTTTTTWDMTVPASPDADKVVAVQMLHDRDFSKSDIQKALPLLMDLEQAENDYFDATHNTVFMLASSHDAGKVDMTSPGTYWTGQQGYRDRREHIWATLDKEIGSDKANALRDLVEPQKIDMSISNYHTAWLDRIDQDIKEWDRQTAARIAANGGTPDSAATNTTVTASTTTTTVDTRIIPDTMYTFPPLTTRELVDTLWSKLTASHYDPEGWMMLKGPDRFTSPDVRMLREHWLGTWK